MDPAPSSSHPPSGALPSVGMQMAHGSLVNLAAMAASNIRGLFTFLVARLLGEAVLGTFALAWSGIDLLSKFGNFGFDGSTTALIARKEASGDRAGSHRIFRHALGWGLLFSSLTVLAGLLAVRWWLDEGTRTTQSLQRTASVLLLALPGIMLYRVGTGVSRGLRVMRHDLYSRGLIEPAVTIGAFLVAIGLGLRMMAPVAAVLLGTLAGGLAAVALARSLFPARAPARSAEPVSGPLLRFSAPIALTNLLNTLTMHMDVLLLGLFVSASGPITLATVGIFRAAVDLSGLMRKLRQVFDPIFMPVVAAQIELGDRKAAEASFGQLGRWVLTVQLLLVGGLWLCGGLLLSLLGPSFRQGAPWVTILALAHATNTFVGLGETLILVQRPALNTINSAVTAVVQCVASVLLIGRWGPTGAALGMLVAYASQGLLRFVELRALFGWALPWQAFRKPCTAFVLALVPAAGLRLALGTGLGELCAAAAFVLLYGAAWWLIGLDAADRAILAELRARRRKAAHPRLTDPSPREPEPADRLLTPLPPGEG